MFVLILQEATHREEVLESKLTALQRQLQSTQEATECNWQVSFSIHWLVLTHMRLATV